MRERRFLCIEAGAEYLAVSHVERPRRGRVSLLSTERVPVPVDAFPNADKMLEPLMALWRQQHFKRTFFEQVLIIVNTRHTSILLEAHLEKHLDAHLAAHLADRSAVPSADHSTASLADRLAASLVARLAVPLAARLIVPLAARLAVPLVAQLAMRLADRLNGSDISSRERKALDLSIQKIVAQSFPGGDGFNDSTHVFSCDLLEGPSAMLFMGALPITVADGMVNLCLSLGFGIHQIKRIDTVEHLLTRYYMERVREPVWLFLPQDNGLRVIVLSDGLPRAVFSISNSPAYRKNEWTRVLLTQPLAPSQVLLFSKDPAYNWLREYFLSQSIPLKEKDNLTGIAAATAVKYS